MSEPIYTQDWISPYFQLWEQLLPKTPMQHILEIGCFEGRATRWFLEHLIGCDVVCLDTFTGGQDHKELGLDFSSVKARFEDNVRAWGELGRVRLFEGESRSTLCWLNYRDKNAFDIALIDGSHLAHNVLEDAVLTWPLMKQGGIVIFDDMGWGGERPLEQTPRPAIEAFLTCYKGQYEPLEHSYQVIVRKL